MAGIIDSQLPPEGEPMPEAEDPNAENDPDAVDKFMYVVESVLSDEKGGLTQSLGETLAKAKDLPTALANAAYDMVASIDEKTGGMLGDEDLPGVAAETLSKMAEIAEAAGMEITSATVARATSLMLARFLEENGQPEGAAKLRAAPPEEAAAQIDQMSQEA